MSLLAVEDLTLGFRTRGGYVRALDRVGFALGPGETLGIVGESGSGKSVSAMAVMDLLDASARIEGGRVLWREADLLRAPDEVRRGMRGPEMAMIFQNPRAALNPIRTVGQQIVDVLRAHRRIDRAAAWREAVAALALVRIADPERRARQYPHELSGGMCQRVMIALALACAPTLLIADEPTTGLDVTTQAVIMDLVEELARTRGMATIFITHDLALAAEHCHRIVVMHAGQVVESGPTASLFADPHHPYTRRLIAATPQPGSTLDGLATMPGAPPDLAGALPPCRYAGRCPHHAEACDAGPPPRVAVAPDHDFACWRAP